MNVTPIRQARRTDQPRWVPAFLAAIEEGAFISDACKAIGRSRSTVYEYRDRCPEFAEAWEDAREIAIYALETTAYQRALNGHKEPIYYNGEKVGERTVHHDKLLMFLLRAMRPEKYRDNTPGPTGGIPAIEVRFIDGKPAE